MKKIKKIKGHINHPAIERFSLSLKPKHHIRKLPGQRRMQGTITMRDIRLHFFPSEIEKSDQYNSFLRRVVAVEEAL